MLMKTLIMAVIAHIRSSHCAKHIAITPALLSLFIYNGKQDVEGLSKCVLESRSKSTYD